MPATRQNQATPPTTRASVGPSLRRRTHITIAKTLATRMPPLMGAITTLRKRLTSSSAGCLANAALPGFGLLARVDARSGWPEPHSSGPNQSSGTSTAKPIRRQRRYGSRTQR